MNVVLVGIKHAGKSALGKALAEMRDTLFVDSDELIEANYLLRTGESLSCREIFLKLGRQEFRKLEAAAIAQLNESSEEDDQERVIALGGGVADNPDVSEEQLKDLGLVVYISIPRDVAWDSSMAAQALISCPRVSGVASCRWVRPVLMMPLYFPESSEKVSFRRFRAGRTFSSRALTAAMCMAVGKVSLELCEQFT